MTGDPFHPTGHQTARLSQPSTNQSKDHTDIKTTGDDYSLHCNVGVNRKPSEL